MGKIRVIEPNVVYSGTHRTVDQCFLFAPNHGENRLLAATCHPDALSPDNDHHPIPSVIDICGASLARAQELSPVKLFWWEVNVNHNHSGVGVNADQMENLAPFFRNANSGIARGINKALNRTGPVLTAR